MKIVLIVVYYGEFPNYFELFLKSCENNKEIDWLIFTDNNKAYTYPSNVKIINLPFNNCNNLIQHKFDFEISLSSYNKLCDYKPAYGYIFSDYIKEYDYWGHCDIDLIFGRILDFYPLEMVKKYDKIGSLGHLTLYRNRYDVNTVFMNEDWYKTVYADNRGYAFDEWLPNNVNELFSKSGFINNFENYGIDIYSYDTAFYRIRFDLAEKKYRKEKCMCIFRWNKGYLKMYYLVDGKIMSEIVPYVHLQKRHMKALSYCPDDYYIVPNKFVVSNKTPNEFLRKCRKYKLVNYQFFKVKWSSLKKRVKNKNWSINHISRIK